MAAKVRRQKPATVPQLYRGAESCDLRPEWDCPDDDRELLAMLEACHAADPDDLTPQLALADLLGERGDARERWVRLGCDLWDAARSVVPGAEVWDYEAAKAALAPACETVGGWRLACLWGGLVAWHAPSGYDGAPMGRTWADARVGVVNRCVWLWSMGLLTSQASAAGSQADAAWSQADAAWSQAYAAWRQADAAGSQASAAGSQADAALSQASAAGSQASAAGSQADAAGSQADAALSQASAAGSQADAAWSQAYAAWRQADAAGSQASAAGSQADAAGSQADAAWSQVWSSARRMWELCEAKLPEVQSWE